MNDPDIEWAREAAKTLLHDTWINGESIPAALLDARAEEAARRCPHYPTTCACNHERTAELRRMAQEVRDGISSSDRT